MNGSTHLIGDIRRDDKIYKVLKQKYFFELFEENKNALVSPKKWEDPFENVILNAEVKTPAGERGDFSFHDDVYGQCWTRHRASDAMWQIYSNKKDAVRIRTTVGALVDSLCAMNGDSATSTCFIGRVEYMSERKLKEFARTIFQNGITPEAIARSLLVKRNAYAHEREVRLIYIEPSKKKHPEGIYKYAINPQTLFDQAMIDGRMEYEDYKNLKNDVVKRTGLPEKKVKRSLLYRQPKGFIVEIP